MPTMLSPRTGRCAPWLATLLLAAYQACLLNAPELWEHGQALRSAGASLWTAATTLAAEVGLIFGITLVLATLLGGLGRTALQIGGVSMMLLSAIASYFMVRYDVVIGYGIVQSVFSSDQALSLEKAGYGLLGWVVLLGVIPAILWWRGAFRQSACPPAKTRQPRWHVALGLLCAGAGLALISDHIIRDHAADTPGGKPAVSASGLVAHRYVPTNWIAGVAMTGANRATAALRAHQLPSPAAQFSYVERTPLDPVTVVLIIGETTRHDHLGLLGYDRATTPRLSQEANLVGFRAESCDTSTRLSLACMFVRPEGIIMGNGFEPDDIQEQPVFTVFRKLGFSIELFAMQSEVGFYHRVGPDFYKMREVIVAEDDAATKQVLDERLLPELEASLRRHPQGRHLIVLHKKGSHFLYSQRYPRHFARWQPECLDADVACSRQALVNAYDNSVLYSDHVLAEVLDRVRDRPALVVFTSDHGESIGEGTHFHGTPRAIAPPEQRRVPLLFWASPSLLADPVHHATFAQLRERAASGQWASHQNLFASVLGCLSIASQDGGINPEHDLCAATTSLATAAQSYR